MTRPLLAVLLAAASSCGGSPPPPPPAAPEACEAAARRELAPLLAEGRVRRASARLDALCKPGDAAPLRLELALRLGQLALAGELLDAHGGALPADLAASARARLAAAAKGPVEAADLSEAQAALAGGHPFDAAERFEAALEADPLDVAALLGAARARAEARSPAAARELWDRAFEALSVRTDARPAPVIVVPHASFDVLHPGGRRTLVRWRREPGGFVPERVLGAGAVALDEAGRRHVVFDDGGAWLADDRHTRRRSLGAFERAILGDGGRVLLCGGQGRALFDAERALAAGPACPAGELSVHGRVLVTNGEDGAPIQVLDAGGALLAQGAVSAWYETQRRVIVSGPAGWAVVDVDGGKLVREERATGVSPAALSEDGRALYLGESRSRRVTRVDLATGARAPAGETPKGTDGFALLPDGRICANVSRAFGRQYERFERVLVGKPRAMPRGWREACAPIGDGRARAYAEEVPRAKVRHLDLEVVGEWTFGPAVSPDGSLAAYVEVDDATDAARVVVVQAGDAPKVLSRIPVEGEARQMLDLDDRGRLWIGFSAFDPRTGQAMEGVSRLSPAPVRPRTSPTWRGAASSRAAPRSSGRCSIQRCPRSTPPWCSPARCPSSARRGSRGG